MALQFTATFCVTGVFFAITMFATGLPPEQERAFMLSATLMALSVVGMVVSGIFAIWGF